MHSPTTKTVLDLAQLQHQAWVDEAAAQRIAAGAAAAIEAAHAALAGFEPGLQGGDEADFLAALEALAGDEP